MKNSLLFIAILSIFAISCENTPQNDEPTDEVIDTGEDHIVTSFVFVGCNRMWWKDTLESDLSTANIDALKNIYSHVAASSQKTDYFFFLGDIVAGEATNERLDIQLKTWNEDYNNGVYSDFKSSRIPMIPVPGNHEMLNQQETPLAGTTETWMKHMGKYMPADRDSITGPTSAVDKMTYGFTSGNIGFIVMNTDTYNTRGPGGIGLESQIPYEWVKQQVAKYNADPSIEHIFVMGHRPFYTMCTSYAMPCPEGDSTACTRDTTHQGMKNPELSNPVWQSFEDNNVASMLSAHVHQYQRMQPNQKTYQLIAGNGGSPQHHHTPPKFFGYTRINVWASGRIEMVSEGYDAPTPYFDVVKSPNWSPRDSLFDMNWYREGAPIGKKCECVTGE